MKARTLTKLLSSCVVSHPSLCLPKYKKPSSKSFLFLLIYTAFTSSIFYRHLYNTLNFMRICILNNLWDFLSHTISLRRFIHVTTVILSNDFNIPICEYTNWFTSRYLMVHTAGIWVVSRILLLWTFATVNVQRKKKGFNGLTRKRCSTS